MLNYTVDYATLSNVTIYIIELCDISQGALAFSFLSVGASTFAPFEPGWDGESTLDNGYVVDQWDGQGGGYRILIGCRRVPSPGATAMTWTLPTGHWWGSFVFNLAGT